MTNIPAISAAVGCALLMGAPAAADETSVQTSIEAGQWQCGTAENSKTGYQCDVITFRPPFGGTPKVYLALSKLDLTGSGSVVLESIAVNVAQVSWSSFQPEVQVTGWTDSTRAQHADLHKSGNWAGTWIAVGLPMSENHVKR